MALMVAYQTLNLRGLGSSPSRGTLFGGLAEWSIALVLKTRGRDEWSIGSNPIASALGFLRFPPEGRISVEGTYVMIYSSKMDIC